MSSWFDALRQDARFGVRGLVRSPGFTAVAVLTLALGIGANVAMFTVVYGVLLKPLPFEQPDRLAAVWSTAPGIGWSRAVLAAAQYFTYREENRVFEDVAVWVERNVTVSSDGESERVPALMVTDGFLPILRVQPVVGRGFTRQDDAPGSPPRVLITYAFWQERLGGDRGVVGRHVTVNGQRQEVIGVLPRGFKFLETRPALITPLRFDRAATQIQDFSYRGLARLKPSVTMQQANRDVARMIALTPQKFPLPSVLGPTWFDDARIGPDVHLLSADAAGDVGRVLWVLLGAIGMVLLIACANVANLCLVRADGRRHELAIRSALGAGRGRLACTLLSESLVLALAGGVAGVALAQAAIGLIRAIAPSALPRVDDIAIDPPVLLFAVLLAVVAGFLFGSIPALRFASPRPAALGEGGRAASDGRDRHRARSVLVVWELALALVLLVASGLMLRTFLELEQVDPGFVRGEQLLAVDISIPGSPDAPIELAARRHEEIAHRIEQIPGVRAVGLSSSVVLEGRGMSNPMLVEDFPQPEGQAVLSRRMKWIAPGYFETLGTTIVAGRSLTWADVFEFAPVVMINERMAREYWQTPAAAVGKRIRESARNPWREIIGVVANERQDGLAQDAPPIMYWPFLVKVFWTGSMTGQRGMTYVIRSERAASPTLLGEIREAVRSVDRGAPLSKVRTFEDITAESIAPTSFALVLLVVAAGVSLLLGVVGIYGVVSFVAVQRTREVGIRLALGAQPREVTGLFVRHVLALAALGVAAGVAAAAALSRLISSMLFGVSATDPATYLVVAGGLVAVTVLAGYLPSRRAARMDPVAALRSGT